jgi:hypothetical protein
MVLLGLMLASVWQGEVHAHEGGGTTHSHSYNHDGDPPDPNSRAGGATSEPLHIHDGCAFVAVPVPVAHGDAWHDVALSLLPDGADSRRPLTAFSPPHRPPIA